MGIRDKVRVFSQRGPGDELGERLGRKLGWQCGYPVLGWFFEDGAQYVTAYDAGMGGVEGGETCSGSGDGPGGPRLLVYRDGQRPVPDLVMSIDGLDGDKPRIHFIAVDGANSVSGAVVSERPHSSGDSREAFMVVAERSMVLYRSKVVDCHG